jgi:hypothetical protein
MEQLDSFAVFDILEKPELSFLDCELIDNGDQTDAFTFPSLTGQEVSAIDLHAFPAEILRYVVSFLDLESIHSVSCLSKDFRSMVNVKWREYLWESRTRTEFPVPYQYFKNRPAILKQFSWKVLYFKARRYHRIVPTVSIELIDFHNQRKKLSQTLQIIKTKPLLIGPKGSGKDQTLIHPPSLFLFLFPSFTFHS